MTPARRATRRHLPYMIFRFLSNLGPKTFLKTLSTLKFHTKGRL